MKFWARFQLDGADIGMYDMVAVTPDGLETRLTDGFENHHRFGS